MDGVVREEGGFSLIEVMIALVVLAIGCVGVIGMFMVADRARAGAAHYDHAAALAGQLLEWNCRVTYDDLVRTDWDGAAAPRSEGSDSAGALHRRWRLQRNRPATGLSTLSVTVSWRDGRDRQIALAMIHADPRAGE